MSSFSTTGRLFLHARPFVCSLPATFIDRSIIVASPWPFLTSSQAINQSIGQSATVAYTIYSTSSHVLYCTHHLTFFFDFFKYRLVLALAYTTSADPTRPDPDRFKSGYNFSVTFFFLSSLILTSHSPSAPLSYIIAILLLFFLFSLFFTIFFFTLCTLHSLCSFSLFHSSVLPFFVSLSLQAPLLVSISLSTSPLSLPPFFFVKTAVWSCALHCF